jgi:hypothetical protein
MSVFRFRRDTAFGPAGSSGGSDAFCGKEQNQRLLHGIEDSTALLEAYFNNRIDHVLRYSENLSERFFDLSYGEAGAILQKFRIYRIRMAVVCSPEVQFSRKFGGMILCAFWSKSEEMPSRERAKCGIRTCEAGYGRGYNPSRFACIHQDICPKNNNLHYSQKTYCNVVSIYDYYF